MLKFKSSGKITQQLKALATKPNLSLISGAMWKKERMSSYKLLSHMPVCACTQTTHT